VKARLRPAALIALLLVAVPAPAADEVGEALEASVAAQRAAKESQGRVDKLADEARALREKRRATEWRALQLSGYAARLEADAVAEENKRKGLEAQLKGIASTGTDLLPLMRRMVAELAAFVDKDLPFLHDARRARVQALTALLDDEKRGNAEKYRRVLEAYRTEVDYGHSLGAEDGQAECDGPRGPVTLVRVGRIGLYCLTADGKHGAAWDAAELESLRHAKAMARAEEPPQLLQLPVRAAGK
jgi:hypothetical protein